MSELSLEDTTNELEMKCKELLEVKDKLKELFLKLNERVDSLQKTAFQLANYYFVSQTVVFTALAGKSSLVCHDVWFPVVLSLVPAFLNFFALGTIGNEYRKVINFREDTTCDIENNKRELDNLNARSANDREYTRATPDPSVKVTTTIYFYACMSAFAVFAIVTAFGSIWILCGEKIIAHAWEEL